MVLNPTGTNGGNKLNLKPSITRARQFAGQSFAKVREFTSKHSLKSFPLKDAVAGYNREFLRADALAGLNTALLAFPQALAFALIAGLPLTYGIMCAAIAAIVGPFLASSRFTMLGPTNGSAFMVFSYFASYPELDIKAMSPLLVLLVGTMLMIGAYVRAADLVNYISRTVMVAYVTGAAVQMIVSQLPSVLGITTAHHGAASQTMLGNLFVLLGQLGQIEWPSFFVAACTLGAHLACKRWLPKGPIFAMALLFGALCGALIHYFGANVPTFAGSEFTWKQLLPPMPSLAITQAAAHFSQLFGLALAVAFLATLENTVMAKTLASRANQRVDQNQDMFSLGVANLACAYLSGMSASGSLTRSALNYESGAKTPISSIISGVLCLIGALTLGGLVGYVPRATLAMLIIVVAVSLIHRRQIRISLRATHSDAFVFIITFIATLLVPLHVAIFTGVGVSVMLYLRKASQPSLVEYEFNREGILAEREGDGRAHPSISIVHVEGELFFGAAELFRTQIQRSCADPNLRIIILRLKNARHLDATSVMALEELIITLRSSGRDLIVSGAMKEVYRVLKDSGLVEVIGRDNIFPGSATNPNIATRNALKRAQKILGVADADVHIFFDPRHQKGASP